MILPIEKWITEQKFHEEVTNLLNEGIKCYKAGAYRAGLLFSYLGFEKIIKNRILNARQPDNIGETTWRSIQGDVSNDAKWEEAVFATITGYSDYPIFLQDNKKREEMNRHLSYWRDRRNDAAHAKENEITYAHVESFWTFMQTNIPKLVVRGSKAAILDNIAKHFDTRFTPKNESCSYIIQQIKHSLYKEDLINFYQDVEKIFDKIDPFFMFSTNSQINKFWDELLMLGEPFSSKLVQYLKSEDNSLIFTNFISEYMHRLVMFHEDKQFIYNLWYEQLTNFTDPYKLIVTLLRNKLIDEANKKTAFMKLIVNLNNKVPSDDFDFKILLGEGFITTFDELVFGIDNKTDPLVNQFDWGNKNLKPVRYYLTNVELDKRVVNCLCMVFGGNPYPYKMCANLKDFFSENLKVKGEFIKISEELGITPPKSLGFAE